MPNVMFSYSSVTHPIVGLPPLIPAIRTTTWKPGVTYNGGIPVRNLQVGATLTPRGSVSIVSSPTGLTEVTTTVTVSTTTAHGLAIGDIFSISGAGVVGYNGTWTAISPTSGTTITYTNTASGLAASGSGTVTLDDTAQIQTAINNVVLNGNNNQFILLGSGTFSIGEGQFVLINKGITVRGSGPVPSSGGTLITRTGGAVADQAAVGVNPSPHFILGPAQYINPGSDGYTNLTADAQKGAFSITVVSTTGFSVGQTVLLDELSNATFITDPAGRGQILASSDFQVTYQLHSPGQGGDDPLRGIVSPLTISAISEVGNTVTVTTAAIHDFVQNDTFNITGVGIAGYNGFFAVSTTPADNTHFTYTNSTTGLGASSGGQVNRNVRGDAATYWSRQDRVNSEVKEIASISGNTITFTSPIHLAYRTSNIAQLYFYGTTHVKGAALESMKLQNADHGQILFNWCNSCWTKSIDNTNSSGDAFAFNYSFRCEIREFYVHDAAWPSPGGAGYNISIGNGSSEILVENGISVMANKVMVGRSAGAGCVIAYNYIDQGFINSNGNWQEAGMNGSHFVGCHHILFEGNIAFNFESDKTHGNSIYHTLYRNHLRGVRAPLNDPHAPTANWAALTNYAVGQRVWNGAGDNAFQCITAGQSAGSGGPTGQGADIIDGTVHWMNYPVGTRKVGTFQTFDDAFQTATINGPLRCAAAGYYSYWMSFVGNVLGQSGAMTGWVYEGTFPNSTGSIWLLGWDDYSPNPVDSQVKATAYRHGNYDFLNNAITWDPNNNNHILPPSLYAPNKPAFFNDGSGYTWPNVDPLTGTVYTQPAKARFDAGTPFTQP